jgi:TPP-dependent pyruvate/acetoin dehydrogenase alpha subunit
MAKSAEKKNKFSKEQYLKWYESMLLMRNLKRKLDKYTFNKKLKAFVTYTLGKKPL